MTKLESAKMIVKQKGSCIDIQCSECCLLPNNCSSRTANRQLAKEYIKEHESVSTRMTKLEQIKQIATQTCCGIVCDTCPLVKVCDERSSKDVAKVALELLSYDSDLSKCRVGDLIWTTQSGWSRIKKVYEDAYYPIVLDKGGTYTLGGKFAISDIAPTAFITPSLCFNPAPKPEIVCPFKKMDKVLASNNPNGEKNYRYFAEYIPDNILSPYFCFVNGGDEWSSKGKTMGWECCEAYKGDTDGNHL